LNSESFRVHSLLEGKLNIMDAQQNQQQPQAAPPIQGHVIDTDSPKPVEKREIQKEQFELLVKEAADHAEEEGDFRRANKLRGVKYEPTFADTAKSVAVKTKNALITVGIALAPLGGVWLIYQGIRLLVPAARKWPALGIKYNNEKEAKVVRLAPAPKATTP
jgi:hypothetical protein